MHLVNNIFGYEPVEEIKLITIPSQISFYNLTNSNGQGNLITNNSNFNARHILKLNQELNVENQYYNLDYQYIVRETSTPSKLYYGRTNRLTFNLMKNSSSKTETEYTNCLINKRTEEEKIKCYDTILKNLEDIFTSKKYNTTNINNGNDEIIYIEKIKVILTTTQNQKNNINSNMSIIDLGECENSLRQSNNLSNESVLFIKILEIAQDGMKIPKIEYDIYSKLNGENLSKLNLNSCKNNKITLSIPANNLDNIDILNPKSDYYNDFCYIVTSDFDTDITLKDRKNAYPLKTVCQDDCDFVEYNFTSKKAKCSCKAKESSSSFANMKIDKNKLLEIFKIRKNILNFQILKCFKILFSKIGISRNVGFYIFIFFIIFHTIALIIFYKNKLDLLINRIKKLILAKNNFKYQKGDKKEKNGEEEKGKKIGEIIRIEFKDKKMKQNENNIFSFSEINNNTLNDNVNNTNNINNINIEFKEDEKKIKNNKITKKATKKKKGYKFTKEEKEADNNDGIINLNFKNNNINTEGYNKNKFENNSKKDINKNLASLMDYNDDEINAFSYDLALKNDKRTYCQFYISLLKTKHKLINAFFYNKDYNSRIIKVDLLLFGFSLNYTVNALFFNDDIMNKVYESKGRFDIIHHYQIIIFSSLISMFLGAFIQMLGFSSDALIDFKKNEETNNVKERGEKLIKKFKIKFALYFILIYILLFCFWYYVSMFGAIYKNTQYLLLEDTSIGFGLSLFLPFVIYLIPGLFRIPALSD